MSRRSSGKKESKHRAFSGTRTSKPAVFLLGFLLILVGIFRVLYNPSGSADAAAPWEVSEAGTLTFPEREEPAFTAQKIEDLYAPEDSDTLKLLSFESRGENLQALLRLPAKSSSPLGLVLLPGAGVNKEAEQGLAVELSKMEYATLTLDQRNLGGINMERDLELFRAGLEPLEYSMVYDALKASDVLAAQPEIDPDTYLSTLLPAKFVQIHSFNDTVISHDLALRTFALAKEPKAMYNVTEATHGYTASMRPYLEKELALLLKVKNMGLIPS
ncbi:alpha/beta hydrolase [Methanosarcina sp.]|uniref:alpha/beta hydrolase n=1 Tax=Methanosarcina sp. TaxID=2213 RepID=UPI003C74075C